MSRKVSTTTTGDASTGVRTTSRTDMATRFGTSNVSQYSYGPGTHHFGSGVGTATTTTRTGREHVISERVVEHEITVPKRIVVEDVMEKTIVIPETIRREEIVEERQIVRQKIVEVAQPVIQERIVEVPEYAYRDQVVEVPEYRVQENIHEVERREIQENIQYVKRVEYRDVEVEDLQYEYREIEIEQIIEVPEIRTEYLIKEIPITQYIDVPVPQIVDIEIIEEIARQIPVPIEATTTVQCALPRLTAKYEKVPVPVYVPKFVEVPFPADLMTAESRSFCLQVLCQIAAAVETGAPSLCTLERLAEQSKDYRPVLEDFNKAMMELWNHHR